MGITILCEKKNTFICLQGTDAQKCQGLLTRTVTSFNLSSYFHPPPCFFLFPMLSTKPPPLILINAQQPHTILHPRIVEYFGDFIVGNREKRGVVFFLHFVPAWELKG